MSDFTSECAGQPAIGEDPGAPAQPEGAAAVAGGDAPAGRGNAVDARRPTGRDGAVLRAIAVPRDIANMTEEEIRRWARDAWRMVTEQEQAGPPSG